MGDVTGFTAPTGIYYIYPRSRNYRQGVKMPEMPVLSRKGGMGRLHPRVLLHSPLTPSVLLLSYYLYSIPPIYNKTDIGFSLARSTRSVLCFILEVKKFCKEGIRSFGYYCFVLLKAVPVREMCEMMSSTAICLLQTCRKKLDTSGQ